MRSMTGYGSGRAALGDGRVVLDVRTVNHKAERLSSRGSSAGASNEVASTSPRASKARRCRSRRSTSSALARFTSS